MSNGGGQDPELVKLYYRIGEVSQIVGVQPHVLRYWETEFRNIRPQKSRKGQRIYSRRDVEKLLRVKDLLRNEGFTIAGARRRLREQPVAASVERPADNASPATAVARVPEASARLSVVDQRSSSSQRDPGQPTPMPAAPNRGTERAAFELVDDTSPRAAPQPMAWSSAGMGGIDAAASAKSMRRRLVEIRMDIVHMLGELGAESA